MEQGLPTELSCYNQEGEERQSQQLPQVKVYLHNRPSDPMEYLTLPIM
jgi:hypothetical protein